MAPEPDSGIETQFTIAGPIPYIPQDTAQDSGSAHDSSPTVDPVVIDDGAIKKRIRRPLDLVRFVVAIALAAGTIALGYFATSTTAGLDTDIEGGVALLPSLVVLALNIIGGIGSLGLPIAGSINLIVRRRFRQLFDALVALFLAVTVLSIAAIVIGNLDNTRLLVAMAGSTSSTSGSTAPILGGILAFITVARLMGRRPWNVLSGVVVVSLILVTGSVLGLLCWNWLFTGDRLGDWSIDPLRPWHHDNPTQWSGSCRSSGAWWISRYPIADRQPHQPRSQVFGDNKKWRHSAHQCSRPRP